MKKQEKCETIFAQCMVISSLLFRKQKVTYIGGFIYFNEAYEYTKSQVRIKNDVLTEDLVGQVGIEIAFFFRAITQV